MDGNATRNDTMYALRGKIVSIPKVDTTLTKEGCAADAKVTGDALEARVRVVDIVDSLTADDTNKPLSAYQGKVLKGFIDKINLSQAGTVAYDNTESGLNATNMQAALDETAALANNAVSKNGGDTIEGPIHVRKAENGYGSLNKNHTSTADYGTQIVDTAKDGKTAYATVCAALNKFTFTDANGDANDVHHAGNKGFGDYKGNGSASPTTVSTNGIGRLLMVYCSSYLAFVTPKGALVVELSSGTLSWMDSSKVFYVNGELTIETANAAFNASNTTYYYQVI